MLIFKSTRFLVMIPPQQHYRIWIEIQHHQILFTDKLKKKYFLSEEAPAIIIRDGPHTTE